jgi:hypothetical protein
MEKRAKLAAAAILLGSLVSAQCGEVLESTDAMIQIMAKIGNPIGQFMMIYMGIKWVVSDGPEERENARRGVIYVVIGLMLLQVASPLVEYLMC